MPPAADEREAERIGFVNTADEVVIKSEGPEQLDQMPSIGIADSAAVIDGQTAAKVFHFPGVGVCGEQLSDNAVDGVRRDGVGVLGQTLCNCGHVKGHAVSALCDAFDDSRGLGGVEVQLETVQQLTGKETAGCWFQSTDFDSRHIVDWFAGERLLAQFVKHVMQSDGPGKDHAETGIFLTCRSEAIEEQQSIAETAISGKSLQHVREFIQQEQQFAMR